MNFEKYLPENLCSWLDCNAKNASDITIVADNNMFVSVNGINIKSPYWVSKHQLVQIVEKICNGSIYANQNTLKYGYITDENGCRIGVCGTCVYDENGKAAFLRDVSAINIRIARDVVGAANSVMRYIYDGQTVYNTLIVSPPSCGKTTMLRDVARNLGSILRVGIVDERYEILIGQTLGKYAFAIKGCTKHDGILMMLRSMSPQVVLTDEIGTTSDEEAIVKLINAGVKIICTAHGYNEKDVQRRKAIASLIEDNVFERIIVLSARNAPGTVEKIVCRKEEKHD
ncbi:MAG: stage III sporulation protein AA [Clostridia bacterium]|nr:stage III sporulation protein AA [Clostridia bacterium]